ncbi:hypothetical protein [Halopseudomonas sp.]|jgi:hypothetical protein|uniref:hypothetical protein n=1 Tax=Halopseudomonas sp. TaxID=2901191 RepID=UPI0039E55841
MTGLARELLIRGDQLRFENGYLLIEPASGKPVPRWWMKRNVLSLCKEIANSCGVDIFVYEQYSTGNFIRGKAGGNGACLQFRSLRTGESHYTIFNVNLTRRRTVGSKKAGSPLPEKQFWISENMAFYSFWASTGLKLPPRLSAFHDYMGRLKGIVFTAESREDGRIMKSTLAPACITQDEIRSSMLTDYYRTKAKQLADNFQTIYPDKLSFSGETNRGLQLVSATATAEHGNTVISKRGKTELPRTALPSSQQSNEAWYDDYDATDSLVPLWHLM